MHKYGLLEHILFPPVLLNKKRLRQRLDGKTILITGASSGIGKSVAYHLADQNVHLVLVARTQDKLVQIKHEIEKRSAKVSVCCADLRNREELADLIQYINNLPNGLDIFVSNAGKSIQRSIFNSLVRYHDFTRTMAVNYFAPVELLLAIIPLLRKSNGQIINISSTSVLLAPLPHWAAYLASKSAFDVWFRSVSPELNAVGIQTTSIYFPLVKTPMILPTPEYQNMPAMSPEHAAGIICHAMGSHRRIYRPWWLGFGELASFLFRRTVEKIMYQTEKRKRRRNVHD